MNELWPSLDARSRLKRYLGAVFVHWKAAGFVGAIGAAVNAVILTLGKNLPWWAWLVVVAVALSAAQYQAFSVVANERDEHSVALAELKAQLETAERSPVVRLTDLITQGDAFEEMLLTRSKNDPAETSAKSLTPVVEAWIGKCREVIQANWPTELSTFESRKSKVSAASDYFFYGPTTTRLLQPLRTYLSNLKTVLVRVS